VADGDTLSVLRGLVDEDRYLARWQGAMDAVESLRSDPDDPTIAKAAHVVCLYLQQFDGEEGVWEAMRTLAHELAPEEYVAAVRTDLEALVNTESELLTARGVPPVRAAQLVEDLRVSLLRLRDSQDWPEIERVAHDVTQLTDALCGGVRDWEKDFKKQRDNPSKRRQVLKMMWRGVKVLGGGTLIAVDIAAAPAVIVAAPSMIGGFINIADATLKE
jgi:hypothetical protein